MTIELIGNVDNVQSWEGKNGFGGLVTISKVVNKKRENLDIPLQNITQYRMLEELLQLEVKMEVDLQQNKFGMRFSNILNVEKLK